MHTCVCVCVCVQACVCVGGGETGRETREEPRASSIALWSRRSPPAPPGALFMSHEPCKSRASALGAGSSSHEVPAGTLTQIAVSFLSSVCRSRPLVPSPALYLRNAAFLVGREIREHTEREMRTRSPV